jgi:nicotinamide-nucleotide amidase
MLRERKLTLAVAESCSGGLLSRRITAIPGASDYYLGGAVTYSNRAKASILGVSEKTLADKGAVSAEVAEEMALGAIGVFRADYALSTTGIAGPSGATAEKPVGLVYIACAHKEQVRAYKYIFIGGRDMVMQRAAQTALDILRLTLMSGKFPEKRRGEPT